MTDQALVTLRTANAARWKSAKLTRDFSGVAKRLVAAKVRYLPVQTRTGVPWAVVAVIHEREADQNWSTQLGQGDPLHHVSVHVPAGRGPFASWEDGAVDALVHCPPFAAHNADWSIGGTLTQLEEYNGLKYAYAGRPSPYVWSGTSIYDPPTGPGGKVLVDHGPIEDVYPSGLHKGQRVVDMQLGCAGLLLTMVAIDPTIKFAE
jgi:lysozyme family protein